MDDRLVEWDYGEYEGITTEEIRDEQPGWTVWDRRLPGRRDRRRRRARADDLLADARRRSPTATSSSSGTGTSAGCW